jgi:shikimate dehydrogenase
MHWSQVSSGTEGRLHIAVLGEGLDVQLNTDSMRGALRDLRVDAQVTPLECTVEEFNPCIEHLTVAGYKAASICNPFKVEAAKLATNFYIVKHGMGVANALKLGSLIAAQNTEVQAFTTQIKDLKPGLALVMGSGRAARSAVMSLFDCGWRIRVWNRNVIRSRPFVIAFETYGKVEMASHPDPVGCTLIVNATPLGAKAGEQPPVRWQAAGTKITAIDFGHRGVSTEFLRSASQRGYKTVDGRELLIEQAAISLEWWLAHPVPREPMYEAIGFRKRTG